MNEKTYYIIAAVAVVFVIYYLAMMAWMKKRKQKQMNDFNANYSGNPLTIEQKRVLAFGSILTYHRSEEILSVVPKGGFDQYIYGLKNQWGISDHDSAVETLGALLELERSTEIDELLNQSPEAFDDVKAAIAKSLKIDIQTVNSCHSAYAWDVCRLVSLSKWCFWSGHISEEEMWAFSSAGVDKATQIGQNWNEYVISFLLGRTIQGFDLDDVSSEAKNLYDAKDHSLAENYKDIDVFKQFTFK